MAALTAEQNNQLEHVLKQRYQQLIAEVQAELGGEAAQHFADFAEKGGSDQGDESVAVALADIAAARADRQINEMREIDASRKRMKQGEYGLCAECGDEIQFERLMAYPTALRCVKCQSVHEKTHAGEGNPSL